ncbi:hypothetical protein L207DRAFT_439130 [Hyaloscypha variabilis F]|uniref:Nucleoporin NUP53 n=1 Tax=Hyaloscypha variabilis (strain UAMH 11265 / GT02V1 / F) TaxID=1149755 RepID=A0A2J6R3T0_HYAVF|nr:hypothetical protein L207DRAFT_439130 [Hyaloscypha variabilis F]
MPPLVLHNVADEELYVGQDGIQRPYGLQFSNDGNPPPGRPRRAVPESGSFGKSTRRSRSRTGTPAAKREDPTLAAADAIFSQFFAQKAAEKPEAPQRKQSISSLSQPNLSSAVPLVQIDGSAGTSSRYAKKEPPKEPTEVILRGFKSTQQYAAIREYERIGGRICEDYPRDAPLEQRRYKSDLRDPASLRRRALTAEEKAKAYKFAGGEHWIKVTFESAEAAEVAVEASPQTILGHIVSAELYRGVPPTADQANPVDRQTQSLGVASGHDARPGRSSSTLPRSFATPSMREIGRGANSLSPPDSTNSSSHTLDTATLSYTSATASSATLTGFRSSESTVTAQGSPAFCSKYIPTAKRMKLLPAEQALLPQQSFSKRVMSNIPLISWLSADIIGSAVPRTEQGDFDWVKASLYWKMVWWIDSLTGWFDVCGNDKED